MWMCQIRWIFFKHITHDAPRIRITHRVDPAFVVRHMWMCQKDSSNLTHTVCFDVSIYRPIGEPEVTNKRMTHLLKLDTFFHTHDARIMTHDASQIWTAHRVDLALVTGRIPWFVKCLHLFTSVFCIRCILLLQKKTKELEWRICIKLRFQLKNSYAETIEMMETAVGDECKGNTEIKEWYKWFNDGRTSVNDDHTLGDFWQQKQMITINLCNLQLTKIVCKLQSTKIDLQSMKSTRNQQRSTCNQLKSTCN